MGEKGVEKRGIWTFGKQRVDDFDTPSTPVLQSFCPQSPILLALLGTRTPRESPAQPIVSQREPLGLMAQPRIPSPRTSRVSEKGSFIRNEIRPASKEWEEPGLLPSAKPINSAPEFDLYGRPISRPREWYYVETTPVERALRWHDKPSEIQHGSGVPLRSIPSK